MNKAARIQLLVTGFSLFAVMMNGSPDPSIVMTSLRIAAAALGFIHLLTGLRYIRARQLLGRSFENTIARLSGIVLILGGITLRLEGSGTVYLIQFFLGFFYIFGLPFIWRRQKERYTVHIDKEGVRYSTLFRRDVFLSRDAIDSLTTADGCLTVHPAGSQKPLHFYPASGELLQDIAAAVEQYHLTA